MNVRFKLFMVGSFITATACNAVVITAIPGPDDQGGMMMPMVSLAASEGGWQNPTAGAVQVHFEIASPPVLNPLTHWSPDSWFAEGAAWRADLSPQPDSVVGMPIENAGNGDLFNNQYGFMFMATGGPDSAYVPDGNSLAIRLVSISSPNLKSFNYGNSDNRWDPIFEEVGSQVLWNGTMWHNYFTLPASAPAGQYTAEFEIFIADTSFSGSTGFAQYDEIASEAQVNPNFTSALVNYEFIVVPEPSVYASVLGLGVCLLIVFRNRGKRQ